MRCFSQVPFVFLHIIVDIFHNVFWQCEFHGFVMIPFYKCSLFLLHNTIFHKFWLGFEFCEYNGLICNMLLLVSSKMNSNNFSGQILRMVVHLKMWTKYKPITILWNCTSTCTYKFFWPIMLGPLFLVISMATGGFGFDAWDVAKTEIRFLQNTHAINLFLDISFHSRVKLNLSYM